MVKIIWTLHAIEDLKNIHDYIATESSVYAKNMVAKIMARVHQLERFPESGKIVPEFEEKTIKELIEGNYRIIYKIHSDHIGIVRVYHSARILK
jgi:toxin ParE1/3/4